MAFLRSDVINRDLIENVLQKTEGTKRVSVSAITVGPSQDLHAGSLLHEQIRVIVSAVVKGKEKEYDWIAKIHRSENESANYARFQGLLETEVNFYFKLVPELMRLRAPMPKTFPVLWGDYKTTEKEILLLENLENEGFVSPRLSSEGLDLAHVILAAEWLAKFHGLCYIAMQRHVKNIKKEDLQCSESWLEEHPWIRHTRTTTETSNQHSSLSNEIVDSKDVSVKDWRRKLLQMAAESIKANYESNKDGNEESNDKIDTEVKLLMQRQDWLDGMKKETWEMSAAKNPENPQSDFVTLCHGEPWSGNVQYRYSTTIGVNNNNVNKSEVNEEEIQTPVESVFGGFHSCTIGKGGYDLAHFLLTSTTREFRTQNLELVLKSYLAELDDVIASQGFQPGIYTLEDLRKDYKRGLVVAISFCVFVMPLLIPKLEEKNNNTKSIMEESSTKNFKDELKNAVKKHHQPGTSDKRNGDEVDGPICLSNQLNSSDHLPEIVKDRLIDGIKEILEENSRI